MAKPFTPKVVTANALLEGDVIYQTATGWTRKLEEAEVLTDEAVGTPAALMTAFANALDPSIRAASALLASV